MQNWMKRAEGELKRIVGPDILAQVFGKGAAFPTLKSVIIPRPGYVFMEADWKQAELFTMAALSGDRTMTEALSTPGKDLHDLTAIEAFKIVIRDSNGDAVPSEYMLELAAQDVAKYGTCEGHEFEAYLGTLFYCDQRGRKMTRKVFKDTLRVSSKSLNFGIPYGRGAAAIALQVKAETGTQTPVQELTAEIEQMMYTWKNSTYSSAWEYMETCAEMAESPGYLENPWGRRRLFASTNDRNLLRAFGREAMNFPVQSTVADTCIITLWMLVRERKRRGLGFKIVNQIHDAILLEVPENEIDATKQLIYETMGTIEIPIQPTPLVLGVDIDIMTRWGVKL